MTKLNRRALFRLGGAAAAVNLATLPVRAEDTPTTPKTPLPPVEAYAAPPFVDEIALSPDGSRVALVTQGGDDKVIMHFTVDNPQPGILTLGPGKIRGLFFGDNQHVILINSVTADLPGFFGNRHEFSSARSINLETGDSSVFFTKENGFHSIVLGSLQRVQVDGEYHVTASNYRMLAGGSICLYRFRMRDGKSQILAAAPATTEDWLITPEGHPLMLSQYSRSSKQWELYYNRAPAGKSTQFKSIYTSEPGVGLSLLGLGRDGQSAIIGFDDDDGKGEYREISPDGILGASLDESADELGRYPLFHPVTGRLTGFARHDDAITYDYSDPLLKKIAEGLSPTIGPDYRLAISEFAEDPRKVIVYGESAYDAGTYFFVDFSTGKVVTLSANYPNLPEEWITQKTAVTYTARDGLDIHAYLTLPPFAKPVDLPLVVIPHGGPQARDYIDFDWQAQCLASRGYAVIQPNFRGSAGYGGDFITKGHGEWGRKMQTDLSDSVTSLAAQRIVDPRRVAILGASYGGYAALAGSTLDPGVYRCAISIAGISDLKSMIGFTIDNSGSDRARSVLYWKRFMGDPKTYDDISPARQAAKADCPVLLIHGSDDTVVPIDQSRRMEKALKAAGKAVEFVTYKGQDHWETVGSHRIEMMKTVLAFLQKHNPSDDLA
ncbi:prolyl oligopeptidase family protein [Asticcacaulis biprosthecium C19]|uniref:Prolyl oligopeptidase family protein n=1 Tax=Asticcacaulis biprosthecium C19 TaxID=715226 RepID=F4QNL0_9CAUL|nr:S9 family peptidase [Asticcacaulis biprosthecium]EGF90918.1 prolyl oligopeptidase family protein [Asticcacaulis biprosthecium C19]